MTSRVLVIGTIAVAVLLLGISSASAGKSSGSGSLPATRGSDLPPPPPPPPPPDDDLGPAEPTAREKYEASLRVVGAKVKRYGRGLREYVPNRGVRVMPAIQHVFTFNKRLKYWRGPSGNWLELDIFTKRGLYYEIFEGGTGSGGNYNAVVRQPDYSTGSAGTIRVKGKKVTFIFSRWGIDNPGSYHWRFSFGDTSFPASGRKFKRLKGKSGTSLPVKRLPVSGRKARLVVECPLTTRCRGRISIKRGKVALVEGRRYSVSPGGKENVKLRLTAAGLAALKKSGSISGTGVLKAGRKKARFKAILSR